MKKYSGELFAMFAKSSRRSNGKDSGRGREDVVSEVKEKLQDNTSPKMCDDY